MFTAEQIPEQLISISFRKSKVFRFVILPLIYLVAVLIVLGGWLGGKVFAAQITENHLPAFQRLTETTIADRARLSSLVAVVMRIRFPSLRPRRIKRPRQGPYRWNSL